MGSVSGCAAFEAVRCHSGNCSCADLALPSTVIRASGLSPCPAGMFWGTSYCCMNIHQAPALQPQDLIRKAEHP